MKLQIGMAFPATGRAIYWSVADIRGSMTRLVSADLTLEAWRSTDGLEVLADKLMEAGHDVRPLLAERLRKEGEQG
jgi:hypothetical protein